MKPGATMSGTIGSVFEKFGVGRSRIPARGRRAKCGRPRSRISSSRVGFSLAGSRTRPFSNQNGIRTILCGMGSVGGSAADQMVEQGHADREAVGDLLEHSGLRAVGHGGIDFQAADDRPGMEYERFRLRELQARGRQLELRNVFVGRERGFVDAFRLHAQHHDDIGAAQAFFHAVDCANARRPSFSESGCGTHMAGSAERDLHTEFAGAREMFERATRL